jgi:bifunctional non-homologous end joining protein LigD
VKALQNLPDETAVDGEVVALDGSGRPSFNLLQNYGPAAAPLVFYTFDVLVLKGKDLTREPLRLRRQLLEAEVLPLLAEPVRLSPVFEVPLADLIEAVRAQGLEGVGRKTPGKQVRIRRPVRRLAKNARQSMRRVRN